MKTHLTTSRRKDSFAAATLVVVFFLSGVAALVFETLWFRGAALGFGNSVHASSLVLASFMAGLALGNVLAARRGANIRRPVVIYVLLECVIGASGLALVLALPHLPRLLAPLWRPLVEAPIALDALRFGLAFVLLAVPTTAMGMTLPLLVKATLQRDADFGRALGTLYGVNTVGAMVGAALSEWLLVPRVGIAWSGAAAAGLNFLAAAGALSLTRRLPATSDLRPRPPTVSERAPLPRGSTALRLLLATALSGAILLGLEVVWFRFLQLFVLSTSRGFAIMLLVVLLGIGSGGLASAAWLRRRPEAYRYLPYLALAGGLLTMATYFGFEGAPGEAQGARTVEFFDTLWLSLRLMFPVSFVSGLLFPLTGGAVFEALREETAAVGWTTVLNTVGAALGAILAGWVLLPGLGVERSIFAAASGYGLVALLLLPLPGRARARSRRSRLALAGLGAIYLLTAVFFPFGLMRNHFVPVATAGYRTLSAEIVEVREGLNETIVYMQERWMGEPYSARLVTNSFSMTATGLRAERYMKLFAYWPLAFHPRVEKALIVAYGFGITASALTASAEVERIDVVDVSRDVIDMSELLYPDPAERPTEDPRVRVLIEDARFYLLTSEERYDLITGEPPPLMIAGVVNLYTQEYFELMRERLNEGGLVTYWLPVVHLAPEDARSVIKGFCNVFDDCALWQGARLELVLTGSRGAAGPVDEERFERLWRDPKIAHDLRTIGFETPGLLLATFVGDAEYLEELTQGAAPLDDDHPYRLGPDMAPREAFQERVKAYIEVVRDTAKLERYRESAWLRERLPPPLFEAGLRAQPYESLTELGLSAPPGNLLYLEQVDRLLRETDLRTPVLWLLGDHHEPTGVIQTLASRGELNPTVAFHLGLRAMAERRFGEAEMHFRRAQEGSTVRPESMIYYRILALAYDGRLGEAKELAAVPFAPPGAQPDDAFWRFCRERFGIERPDDASSSSGGR